MKLAAYLSETGTTLEAFGARINRSGATVSRIARGLQHPDKATIEAIAVATEGAVTPGDFFDVPAPASAQPADEAAA
jgi:transcriptional regulator with XRE-family HTH domain